MNQQQAKYELNLRLIQGRDYECWRSPKFKLRDVINITGPNIRFGSWENPDGTTGQDSWKVDFAPPWKPGGKESGTQRQDKTGRNVVSFGLWANETPKSIRYNSGTVNLADAAHFLNSDEVEIVIYRSQSDNPKAPLWSVTLRPYVEKKGGYQRGGQQRQGQSYQQRPGQGESYQTSQSATDGTAF